MILTRLFAAALVICSLPAFTQDQQSQRSRSSASPCRESWTECPAPGNVLASREFFFFDWHDYAAAPSEPWMVVANRPADLRPGVNALDPAHPDPYRYDQVKADRTTKNPFVSLATGGQRQEGDIDCLRIRSYVVARDSKDSDSTHPVSYSTCQPSSRYGLKTTEMRTSSADR